MDVDSSLVGLIIGKCGVTVKQLRARHNVKIWIDPDWIECIPGQPTQTVVIEGKENGDITRCKAEIAKILNLNHNNSKSTRAHLLWFPWQGYSNAVAC